MFIVYTRKISKHVVANTHITIWYELASYASTARYVDLQHAHELRWFNIFSAVASGPRELIENIRREFLAAYAAWGYRKEVCATLQNASNIILLNSLPGIWDNAREITTGTLI